jgi:hypothetical protein
MLGGKSGSMFLEGDKVKSVAAPGKYLNVMDGDVGTVSDVYVSKDSGEVVYEVNFKKAPLILMREADLRSVE